MSALDKPKTIDQAVDFVKAVTFEPTISGETHPQFGDLISALLGREITPLEKELAEERWLMGLLI